MPKSYAEARANLHMALGCQNNKLVYVVARQAVKRFPEMKEEVNKVLICNGLGRV